MGIKSCWNVLIVSVILGKGIAVASEENKETSLALHPPEKRASSSSGIPVRKMSGLRISRLERIGFLKGPRSRMGLVPPPPNKGPLPLGMVRIYHGEKEIGIGVVATPFCFAAKAHLFRTAYPGEISSHYRNGEYHIEYRDQNGETFERVIRKVSRNKDNIRKPWGPNDVCLVFIDVGPQKSPAFTNLLEQSKLFTDDQMMWIQDKTGEV